MSYEIQLESKKLNAEIKEVKITDRQGAQADEIRFTLLNDTSDTLTKEKRVECVFDGFKSGKMHIDKIVSTTRATTIGAISIPLGNKVKRTRHWNKVRLFDIVNDVAFNSGLSVFYQGITNHFYENVTQFKEVDLSFLNRLCTREGYALKVDNERLVIYNKAFLEAEKEVDTIRFNNAIDNQIVFAENPNAVRSVTVKYFNDRLISYTATSGTVGEDKTITEYLANEAEAERFAKSYLAYFQENAVTVDALIPLNDGIAAGSCVAFKDFARYDGKYFIFECLHDPENDQTRIKGRKINCQ
jgi:phage protein D